jgi:proteasome assembly chaperone (PAC2) family protein
MANKIKLHHPWLVAVWPGMGHVALNAGYYMLAKLDMAVLAELDAGELFDIDHVEVKDGMIEPARRPRNRFFVWNDPEEKRDLVVFLGEAQPPIGRYPFCKQLVTFAKEIGIERVITFAAMATRMHPEHRARVFGAATNEDNLEELKRLELELLEEGHIGGLNGVLLGAAAEAGLHGMCLLGEMPHVFAQLPFPKASLAVLETFTTMFNIEIDFAELHEQAKTSEEQLGELLARVEEAYGRQASSEDEEMLPEPSESKEKDVSDTDRRKIDTLFNQAKKDRSKAFELKRELDRLNVFKEYEDRFLDLFKKPG